MSRPRSYFEPPIGVRHLTGVGLLVGIFLPLLGLKEGDPSLVGLGLLAAAVGYAVSVAIVIYKALAAYDGPDAQGSIWRIVGILAAGFAPTLLMAIWSQNLPEVLYPAFYWSGSGCGLALLVALTAANLLVAFAENRKGLG